MARTLLPLCLLLGCPPALALEATWLRQEITLRYPRPDGSEKTTRSSRQVLLARRMARLEEESGEVTIVRFDRGRLYEVDTLLECYFERDIRNLRARWKKVNALLLKEIAGMPPGHPMRYDRIDALTDGPEKWELIWALPDGERKEELLRKYHLPPRKPSYKVVAEKKEKEICGHRCRLYRVLEDGKMRAFAWVAADIPLERDLVELLRVSGLLPEELARELSRVRGFPLEYGVVWRDGRVEHTVTRQVERKDVEVKEVFEVPAGYVRQERRGGF